ncbi:MAG TPA: YciI family protein [Ktedonobacterales bacterium]|nr:YciI family protein [Ktedonobacterales bacterium]
MTEPTPDTQPTDDNTPMLTPLPGMEIVYLCLLLKGPAWTADETPEVQQLQQAHLANIRRLVALGKKVVVGPILDGGDLRGVSAFRVGSAAEARELMATDPAVQAGRFTIEIHPWMVAIGALPGFSPQ